jgi:Fe-S cluster assembly iron-binding protein IscA
VIGITERAKEELKELLDKNSNNPQARLRLTANDEGKLGLGIDVEKPEDEIVEYQGANLLVVEPGLSEKLNKFALDVVDDDEGHRLIVVNQEPEEK